MAKKKVSRPAPKESAKLVKKPAVVAKKSPVVKKVVKREAVSTTKGSKPAAVAVKKSSVKGAASVPVKAPSQPAAPAKETPKSTPDVSLGRPLVTQEEKLYMLFHDDYHSRQVFEFLRVETVRDLEQFSPQQIIHLLSKPIRMTVDRIRQRLAKYKRSLRDDEQFAVEYGKLMDPV
ncbi:MAG: hypothetical protein AABP62_24130 [Planctomycetota bacterium]